MSADTRFAHITWQGRTLSIEYQWITPPHADERAPLVVFLHEGLGSVAIWKDFPQHLCNAGHFHGMVFSRPGYGRSTPRAEDEFWGVDFMHRQAYEVLPALLKALGITQAPWLVGHSDGGSIALLYASRFPSQVSGLVLLAPHLFVEDLTIASIRQVHADYQTTDLPQRLARYHNNPDSPFGGWSTIWLSPSFRQWNIQTELQTLRCPVLAVQGLDDAYGTLAHIRSIAAQVPTTELLELPHCGHSPHRDKPLEVIAATLDFMARKEAKAQNSI